ncbi:hypothetical protein PENPOL_c028G04261 [Penicillium polonicum]|uniref:Uncharacterized protein n=1 Tax=Penicillium polonicum TaxID=60169 RepID=A0A1V6N5Z3_PENPO|nr:hypothetical protein PENPOL_c028G04261 [Penicillium polonicum]
MRYPRGRYVSYDVHNKRTSPSTHPSIHYLHSQHLTVQMCSATSFAEPKLSELVPTLTGESNFASWSTALKYALDTRDPHLFEILTGHMAQPVPKDPTLPE